MQITPRFLLLAILALFCILSTLVGAENHSEDSPVAAGQSTGTKNDNEDATTPINYLISFLDDAEEKDMEAVQGWLKEKKASILETVNESYVKFIVAKMDSSISKRREMIDFYNCLVNLLDHKTDWKIEAVEEDDFSSYDEL